MRAQNLYDPTQPGTQIKKLLPFLTTGNQADDGKKILLNVPGTVANSAGKTLYEIN